MFKPQSRYREVALVTTDCDSQLGEALTRRNDVTSGLGQCAVSVRPVHTSVITSIAFHPVNNIRINVVMWKASHFICK